MGDGPGGYPGHVHLGVDVYSLKTYAMAVFGELKANVVPNAKAVRRALGRPEQASGSGSSDLPGGDTTKEVEDRTFGVDPRYEYGRLVGSYHISAVDDACRLMDQFQQGLLAIAYASARIAEDYQTTDKLNAMDEAKVDEVFNQPPAPPRRGPTPI